MNEEVIVEQQRNRPRGAGGAKKSRRFTVAETLRAVRLYREEGFSPAQVWPCPDCVDRRSVIV